MWSRDNHKEQLLWEMGNLGSVTGDVFVKVAYEPPYTDAVGRIHPGKVLILPINPSFAFPEWHPHAKGRLLRFKLKYRFWGTAPEGTRQVYTYCVDDSTQALTREGWKSRWELTTADSVLAVDPVSKQITWEPVLAVNEFDWDGSLTRWRSTQIDALTTPHHRWLVENWRQRDKRYAAPELPHLFKTTEQINTIGGGDRLILSGGVTAHWPAGKTYSNELTELLAWVVNEGYYWRHSKRPNLNSSRIVVTQSEAANPSYVERLRYLAKHFTDLGYTMYERFDTRRPEMRRFIISRELGFLVRDLAPDKQITPAFLTALTEEQAWLFYDTCIDGDGHRRKDTGLETWSQKDQGRTDSFQMLVSMLGQRSSAKTGHCSGVTYTSVYRKDEVVTRSISESEEYYQGKVWCPSVRTKTWLARRDGCTYWTGNTEIITDETIEEYVNDELIDQRPNPLGVIPIVHIANQIASASPWGLSDITDVVPLNREYNEKATDISDIINYHCVSEDTEVLTFAGWKMHTEVQNGDLILTRDPATDAVTWEPAEFNRFDYSGNLMHWTNGVDALSTPGHRWLAAARVGRDRRFAREIVRTSEAMTGNRRAADLQQGSRILVGGGNMLFPTVVLPDDLVDLVGWWVTEGSTVTLPSGTIVGVIHQSATANPDKVESIRLLAKEWQTGGHKFTEQKPRPNGVIGWYLGASVVAELEKIVPGKSLPAEFLTKLSRDQAERLHGILLDADGSRINRAGRSERSVWYQDDSGRKDGYQMLCAMLGIRTLSSVNNRGNGVVTEYQKNHISAKATVQSATEEFYEGQVWCPTVANGIWMARRNGSTYWTGNTAPVTIITGGKPSNLEKGAKKVWALTSDKAKVYNLEGGEEGLPPALEYLDKLKSAMHEMTGVPESALGQAQPISNTSGVALSIQFMPTMQKYNLKKTQYGTGYQQINRLALLVLFTHEPLTRFYDPDTDGIKQADQAEYVDPDDPNVYETDIIWPPPLPVDILIKLSELQIKQELGLESKKGALRELGEQFPDEKLQELFEELIIDQKQAGALEIIHSSIMAAIMELTGVMPEGAEPVPAAPASESTTTTAKGSKTVKKTAAGPVPGMPGMGDLTAAMGMGGKNMMADLVTQAYGTKLPQLRDPDKAD